MKINKYNSKRIKENRINKFNEFIVTDFCFPLKIPKIIYQCIKNKIKKHLKKKEYLKYNVRDPIYNELEIPDRCFKKKSSKMITKY